MNFRTYTNLSGDICSNLHKIPRDIDCVVGIPRSGLLAATMIAQYLNKPVAALSYFLQGGYGEMGSYRVVGSYRYKKALIVDDLIGTGEAMDKARKLVGQMRPEVQAIFMAVYAHRNIDKAEICLVRLKTPRAFSWNVLHHDKIKTAWDMDGVICRDPPKGVEHPSRRYYEFIQTAEPLIIPTWPVECIVTGRLEPHRDETVRWLKQHGVEYGKLIMKPMGLRGVGNTPKFKAGHYKKSKAEIFIESCKRQSPVIAKLSGKPVYCIEEQRFYK